MQLSAVNAGHPRDPRAWQARAARRHACVAMCRRSFTQLQTASLYGSRCTGTRCSDRGDHTSDTHRDSWRQVQVQGKAVQKMPVKGGEAGQIGRCVQARPPYGQAATGPCCWPMSCPSHKKETYILHATFCRRLTFCWTNIHTSSLIDSTAKAAQWALLCRMYTCTWLAAPPRTLQQQQQQCTPAGALSPDSPGLPRGWPVRIASQVSAASPAAPTSPHEPVSQTTAMQHSTATPTHLLVVLAAAGCSFPPGDH